MFSFFDQVDLGGKNVYIFTTHAGSGLNNNPSRVKEVEPDANVSTNGLAISGSQMTGSPAAITKWLEELNLISE